jgi:hypothetical protein
MMKPCCLTTDETKGESECLSRKEEKIGGKIGWSPTCPTSSREAAELMDTPLQTITTTTTVMITIKARKKVTDKKCTDIENGAKDLAAGGCGDYSTAAELCGQLDDEDFKAHDMCCACGGGSKIIDDDEDDDDEDEDDDDEDSETSETSADSDDSDDDKAKAVKISNSSTSIARDDGDESEDSKSHKFHASTSGDGGTSKTLDDDNENEYSTTADTTTTIRLPTISTTSTTTLLAPTPAPPAAIVATTPIFSKPTPFAIAQAATCKIAKCPVGQVLKPGSSTWLSSDPAICCEAVTTTLPPTPPLSISALTTSKWIAATTASAIEVKVPKNNASGSKENDVVEHKSRDRTLDIFVGCFLCMILIMWVLPKLVDRQADQEQRGVGHPME